MTQKMFCAVCALFYLFAFARGESSWREWEQARVRLHARKALFAASHMPEGVDRLLYIAREKNAMDAALAALAQSTRPAVERGRHEVAYECDSDGSAQPFVIYLPSEGSAPEIVGLPLVVYLHGYSPYLNLLNWDIMPAGLTNLAERLSFAVAMPFGRGNTDFQGIGERDVLRVVDEMQARYNTHADQTILCGYSMGGMGAWTMGTRFAERFNGLLMVSARGDYHVWHGITPEDLPAWRLRLVNDAFPRTRLDRLADMPIFAVHGAQDVLIAPSEARAIHAMAAKHNPDIRLVILPGANHWIAEETLAMGDTRSWLKRHLRAEPANRPEPLGVRPGETPSRLQNAFLEPFAFVIPNDPFPHGAARRAAARADEWERFAKAPPRLAHERTMREEFRQRHNLFVFGEPEDSPLIQAAFDHVGGRATAEAFHIGGRELPRTGHGLWLATPSPFAAERTLVVQCGAAWGPRLPDNHRYDLLPDVMLYRERNSNASGEPEVVAAGYVTDDARIIWED